MAIPVERISSVTVKDARRRLLAVTLDMTIVSNSPSDADTVSRKVQTTDHSGLAAAAGLSGAVMGTVQTSVTNPVSSTASTSSKGVTSSVNMIVEIPYSVAEFDEVSSQFTKAVSDAAGVSEYAVTLNSWKAKGDSRRALSDRLIVDFTVTGIAKAPSKSDLNKKLSEAGLREILKVLEPEESTSNVAIIVGAVLGSVVGLNLLICVPFAIMRTRRNALYDAAKPVAPMKSAQPIGWRAQSAAPVDARLGHPEMHSQLQYAPYSQHEITSDVYHPGETYYDSYYPQDTYGQEADYPRPWPGAGTYNM